MSCKFCKQQGLKCIKYKCEQLVNTVSEQCLRMCARCRADGVFLRFKVSLDNVPRDWKFTFLRIWNENRLHDVSCRDRQIHNNSNFYLLFFFNYNVGVCTSLWYDLFLGLKSKYFGLHLLHFYNHSIRPQSYATL